MYDDSSDLSPIAGNREKRKKKGEREERVRQSWCRERLHESGSEIYRKIKDGLE